jgi:hypothetical protein
MTDKATIDWNAAFELRLASIETALYNLSEAITELKRVILEEEGTGETLGSEDSERSVDEEDDDYEDEDDEE